LCNTPCRLPRRGRTDPGGDWDTAMRQSVGTWSTATIDMRLDTRVAPNGLKDWYISEMDRTSPSIGRKLQGYLDTLDFSPHLSEVETPTLLLTGEESPTSTLEQQRFMAAQLPNARLVVYPGLGHGVNAIYPEWCTQQVREFAALTEP
jgi:pimeloyl-ACP methyl ester carboxylesterase